VDGGIRRISRGAAVLYASVTPFDEGVIMRVLRLLLTLVVVLAVFVGFRWYRYVTNEESPYQEIGIELNSRMPTPLKKWGCDRLHATFGNVLPPYGCQAGDDGRSWL
jgi:hypothetical protein